MNCAALCSLIAEYVIVGWCWHMPTQVIFPFTFSVLSLKVKKAATFLGYDSL